MTDTPGGLPPSGPTSDRMQALLSQFQEEQVTEQRTVSTVLAALRAQVAVLSDSVRLTASDASVERLGEVVGTVVADLRTSTSLLGQRIEGLSKRIEAVAQDTAAPTEQAVVRLSALQADIAAQAEAVERMQAALEVLSGFPSALAALQKDVAGLHDRVQPLAEIRSTVGDIGARTSHSLESLKPQLEGLQVRIEAMGGLLDPERVRDAVVDALGSRLDRLEQAAERPVVGPEVLKNGLGDLRASIDGAMGDRLEEIQAALGAVENRLGQVGERLADVGDAAGGVPALRTDLTRLAARVEELLALQASVATVGQGVQALTEDSTGATLTAGIASLREDLQQLGERITQSSAPPVDEIAALVSQRVADRLVETLAPRIADVVLTRVSAALASQLGEALSPQVKADTENVVRQVTADSERRVLAHVDEAVLALAEALLRRRRGGRTATTAVVASVAHEDAPAPGIPDAAALLGADEPVQDIVDRINAVDTHEDEAPVPADTGTTPVADAPAADVSRPAVTTGLAPARMDVPAPPAEKSAEPEPTPEPVQDSGPVPELPASPPPAKPKGTGSTPRRDLTKRRTAPAASIPQPKAQGPDALKPAARAKSKTAPPPVRKSSRPPTKPKPILDRTPDLQDEDFDPVRTAPPRPRPAPAAAPETTEAAKPVSNSPQNAPVLPPAPSPPVGRPPEKRKPWWRPGG